MIEDIAKDVLAHMNCLDGVMRTVMQESLNYLKGVMKTGCKSASTSPRIVMV